MSYGLVGAAGAVSKSATSTPSPVSAVHVATSPAAANSLIVGLGATDADWNAHHDADAAFAAGAVYDPDPTLPQINGHTGARYTAVQHQSGRVTFYTMNLHPGTSIAEAKAQALKEFPADVVIAWFNVKSSCAQLAVQSATLGKALGASGYGDAEGYTDVEFDTASPDGTASYDPKDINEVLFIAVVDKQASDAGGC